MFDYYLGICSRILLFASVCWTATDLWFVVCSSSNTFFEAGKFFTPFFYIVRIPLTAPGFPDYSLRKVMREMMKKIDPHGYDCIMRDMKKCEAALALAIENGWDTTKLQEKLDFLEQVLFHSVLCSYVNDLKKFPSLSGFTKLFWGCQIFKYDNDKTIETLSESAFWVKFKDRATRCLAHLEAVTGRHVDYNPQMLSLPTDQLNKIGIEK